MRALDGSTAAEISDVLAAPGGGVDVAGFFADQATFAGVAFPGTTSTQGLVARLDRTGTIAWYAVLSGTGSTMARTVMGDGSGVMYAAGSFSGDLTIGDTALHSAGGSVDTWLAAFASDGAPLWASSFGGAGDEEPFDLDVTSSGRLCVAGNFTTSFDAGNGVVPAAGGLDIFIACFAP
jgi:hypothetical protein